MIRRAKRRRAAQQRMHAGRAGVARVVQAAVASRGPLPRRADGRLDLPAAPRRPRPRGVTFEGDDDDDDGGGGGGAEDEDGASDADD